MHLWLSDKVFSWNNSSDGGHLTDAQRTNRPHEILAHCDNLVENSNSEFSIADAVLGLKRSINSRLQHIEELYKFSLMFPKSVGSLERLEKIGLIRPFLVKQFFDLRNDIEHNDARPPTHIRARELVDLTWYFLKTTDFACKVIPDGVQLHEGDEDSTPPSQWISIRPTPRNGQFDVCGWIHEDFFSSSEKDGFIKINATKIKKKEEFTPNRNDSISMEAYAKNLMRDDGERWIIGTSALHQNQQVILWRLALAARS